jgi:hypothetical protein
LVYVPTKLPVDLGRGVDLGHEIRPGHTGYKDTHHYGAPLLSVDMESTERLKEETNELSHQKDHR